MDHMHTDNHGIVHLTFETDVIPPTKPVLEVIVDGPAGERWQVPGFARGAAGTEANRFGARFFPPAAGEYSYRAEWVATDAPRRSAGDGSFAVDEATPGDDERRRGRLRVAAGGRHLEWANGERFLWLADTWWMAFSPRIDDAGFTALCRDRKAKGFSVVQLVAGLFPDMPPLDERGANGGGTAWLPDFSGVNPDYYDEADRRIETIVDHGLVPCIVGCWGYYLSLASEATMREHWRHLVARYAAYPVVFCLAGETRMPYYLSPDPEGDRARQTEGWTRIARFVRETDPYGNLLTTHPDQRGREQLTDPSLLDFEMLQTGHSDRASLPFTITAVRESHNAGAMPVIDSEVCYEGIGAACREEVQRYLFWICVLNGACGHTYGANGLWQANGTDAPYGPSPHGMEWGDVPWTDAMNLPGSAAVGRQKRFLEELPWWTLEPAHDVTEHPASAEHPMRPHAARSRDGKLCLIYFPEYPWRASELAGFPPQTATRLQVFDPVRGALHDRSTVTTDARGRIAIPGPTPDYDGRAFFPFFQDWLLIVRTADRPTADNS